MLPFSRFSRGRDTTILRIEGFFSTARSGAPPVFEARTALKVQCYGVISNTVPEPYAPPTVVVP